MGGKTVTVQSGRRERRRDFNRDRYVEYTGERKDGRANRRTGDEAMRAAGLR